MSGKTLSIAQAKKRLVGISNEPFYFFKIETYSTALLVTLFAFFATSFNYVFLDAFWNLTITVDFH